MNSDFSTHFATCNMQYALYNTHSLPIKTSKQKLGKIVIVMTDEGNIDTSTSTYATFLKKNCL